MTIFPPVSRQWVVLYQNAGVALAIFAIATACAVALGLHLSKEYEATARLVQYAPPHLGHSFEARNASAEAQELLSDENISAIERHFDVYPAPLSYLLKSWVTAQLRHRLSFAFMGDSPSGEEEISLSFADRNRATARGVTNAVVAALSTPAESIDRSTTSAGREAQAPLSLRYGQTSVRTMGIGAPTSSGKRMLTQRLERALRQDRRLHSELQSAAGEWAQVYRKLATSVNSDRDSLSIARLDQERERLEADIVNVQKQIEINHNAEEMWKAQLSSKYAASLREVDPVGPVDLEGQPNSADVSAKPRRGRLIVSSNVSTKLIPTPSHLNIILLFSFSFGLTFSLSIVFMLDRVDGSIKTKSDLHNELPASVTYLGDIPRIRHETIYR